MSGRPRDLQLADAHARLAAQRVFDRSVVLEAGAGTGKTSALVARVVCWSLGSGWQRAADATERTSTPAGGAPHPDRVAARVLEGVVAITFTDAAAAEMAGRVAAALAALAGGEHAAGVDAGSLPADDATRRERARALLHAIDRLRVSTIHAYCSRLLAANPAEGGVHPAFVVDADETRVDEIARAAVGERLRGDPAGPEADDLVSLAASGVDPDRIAGTLGALVRTGVPEEALAADPFSPERVAALAAALLERVAALGDAVGDRFSGLRSSSNARKIATGIAAVREALGTRRASGRVTLVDLKALLAEHLPEALREHLGGWAKGALGAAELGAAGDAAGAIAVRAADLSPVLAAVERCDEALLGAACRVLAPLLAAVRRTMRDAGVVTYADLLGGCRDLLVGHPAVAARERRAIDLLVVDEFQDTDALQCEIVAALALDGDPAERPNLFLVGDPKQSIYGWRNADLAAYEAFVERVLAAGGVRHALSVNFRSVPAVLAEVERCVAPVMAYERGVQPPFEPLLACEARRGEPGFARGGRAPVEHWVIDDAAAAGGDGGGDGVWEDPVGATAVEASAVAADIAELHAHEGVAWAEFALLFRAATDLPVYLQALRDAGVPYAVERDRTFYRRREVIEAAALVRAVLDPTDHIALLAWLRSAPVGVPDAALLPLWSRGFPALMTELSAPDAGELARVRDAVAAAAAAMPAVPGGERIAGWERSLGAAVGALARARAAFATLPAAEFVEVLRTATLVEATEAARALGLYRVANLDRFFRALLAAMEESGSHPQAVLRALRRALREQPEAEEGRPRDAALDAVRVMTIHKAKGLDFAHVYLLQAGRRVRSEAPAAASAERVDDRWELSLFGLPSPGWWRASARARRVAEAELVRTLYVAMTRARVRLVIASEWSLLPAGKLERRPSHLRLLAARAGGVPDVEALLAAAAGGAPARLDHAGARWVVPVVGGGASSRRHLPEAAACVAAAVDVAAQARALARLGLEAGARMRRPWSAPASAEAHRRFDEDGGSAGREAPWRSRGGSGRDLATAAGTLVHRFLEGLDLFGDIAAQLAAAPATLSRLAESLPPGGADAAAAAARAGEVVGGVAASPIAARLAAIAPHVVARELPVLVAPRSDPGASGGAGDAASAAAGPVAFVAGAVDLVYRDPATGELVIADYKTDGIASPEELARRAAVYRGQGDVYRTALRDALGLAADPAFELWFLAARRILRLAP